jgi:hypothetical protein
VNTKNHLLLANKKNRPLLGGVKTSRGGTDEAQNSVEPVVFLVSEYMGWVKEKLTGSAYRFRNR